MEESATKQRKLQDANCKTNSSLCVNDCKHFIECAVDHCIPFQFRRDPRWALVGIGAPGYKIPNSASEYKSLLLQHSKELIKSRCAEIGARFVTICVDGGATHRNKFLGVVVLQRGVHETNVFPWGMYDKDSDDGTLHRVLRQVLSEMGHARPVAITTDNDDLSATASIAKSIGAWAVCSYPRTLQLEVHHVLQTALVDAAVKAAQPSSEWRVPNETHWWSLLCSFERCKRIWENMTFPELRRRGCYDALQNVTDAATFLTPLRLAERRMEENSCTIYSAIRLVWHLMSLYPCLRQPLRDRFMRFAGPAELSALVLNPLTNFSSLPLVLRNFAKERFLQVHKVDGKADDSDDLREARNANEALAAEVNHWMSGCETEVWALQALKCPDAWNDLSS